jgi:hypothetical protein
MNKNQFYVEATFPFVLKKQMISDVIDKEESTEWRDLRIGEGSSEEAGRSDLHQRRN